MKFFNIATKKTYEQNGEQKTKWYKVGTLKLTDDDKQFIELNMFPNQPFYVFEQKDKEPIQATKEVNVDEIPF